MQNPNIILAGRQPDLVNTLNRANVAAAGANQVRDQNALRQLYQAQGAGIAQGNPQALNALAQLNPQAALDVQNTQNVISNRDTRTGIMQASEKRAAEAYARSISAAQRAAEAAEIERGLIRGISLYKAGDLAGLNQFLASEQLPTLNSLDDFPALAVQHKGVFDALTALKDFEGGSKADYVTIDDQLVNRNAPGGPAVVPIAGLKEQGPEWRDATPEEMQQGVLQVNTKTNKKVMAPKGLSIKTDGKGGLTFSQGVGVTGAEDASVGDVYNPGEVQGTIDLIDEIASDPSLGRVTGSLQGGGGNDVAQFNVLQRGYYGDQGLAVIQKINQLQSRSWLAARAMLKGGGPITDYESRKAEAAVARLERAQGDTEFKAALTDLRDAITDGMAKLEAAQGDQSTPEAADQGSGGQFQFESPDQKALFEKYATPTGG